MDRSRMRTIFHFPFHFGRRSPRPRVGRVTWRNKKIARSASSRALSFPSFPFERPPSHAPVSISRQPRKVPTSWWVPLAPTLPHFSNRKSDSRGREVFEVTLLAPLLEPILLLSPFRENLSTRTRCPATPATSDDRAEGKLFINVKTARRAAPRLPFAESCWGVKGIYSPATPPRTSIAEFSRRARDLANVRRTWLVVPPCRCRRRNLRARNRAVSEKKGRPRKVLETTGGAEYWNRSGQFLRLSFVMVPEFRSLLDVPA